MDPGQHDMSGHGADVAYGNLADDVMYGNLGADSLYGGQGNDLLQGNLGDDTLQGGLGADLFAIGDGGGSDVVSDFDGGSGDTIRIATDVNCSRIDSFAELVTAASDTDAGVQIALGGGNTLTLNGVTVSQLQSGWFTFG